MTGRVLARAEIHKRYHDSAELRNERTVTAARILGVSAVTVRVWKKQELGHTGLWIWEKVEKLRNFFRSPDYVEVPVQDLARDFGLHTVIVYEVAEAEGRKLGVDTSLQKARKEIRKMMEDRKETVIEKLKQIEDVDKMPRIELASRLGICESALYALCRRYGIKRTRSCEICGTDISEKPSRYKTCTDDCRRLLRHRSQIKSSHRLEFIKGKAEADAVVSAMSKIPATMSAPISAPAQAQAQAQAPISAPVPASDFPGPGPGIVLQTIPEAKTTKLILTAAELFAVTEDTKYRIQALRDISRRCLDIADMLIRINVLGSGSASSNSDNKIPTQSRNRAKLLKSVTRSTEQMFQDQVLSKK